MSDLLTSTEFSGYRFELWKVYFDNFKPNKGFFLEILVLSPEGKEVGYVQLTPRCRQPGYAGHNLFDDTWWKYTGHRGIFFDPPTREIEDFCNQVFDDEIRAAVRE